MTVAVGGELFTGNCMMSMALADRKITLLQMLRNLVVVYISNFAGAVFVAVLVYYSGQFDYSGCGMGAYTIHIAMNKTGLDFSKALVSGILCNILVCIAVLVAGAVEDILTKLIAVFFPIMAFVTSGFEHCVANMYYIPAGILAGSNSEYVDKACELYGYTAAQIKEQLTVSQFLASNLLPVTIGNIIGGGLIVGLGLYAIVAYGNRK